MQHTLPWILGASAVVLLVAAAALRWIVRRRTGPVPLPTEWTLSPRPVFSTDERRVYRQLREALPHHVILSKLPLVRFCQPADPSEVRYWYELLGQVHVTFAICSPNGRVLAAIDLEHPDRSASRRVQQIKQSVLTACRVRYLRCPPDHLPTIPELQLLVPQSLGPTRGPHPAPAMAPGRDGLGGMASGSRRRERATLWQDSGFFQDSFFGAEARPAGDLPLTDWGALRGPGRAPGESGGPLADNPPPARH